MKKCGRSVILEWLGMATTLAISYCIAAAILMIFGLNLYEFRMRYLTKGIKPEMVVGSWVIEEMESSANIADTETPIDGKAIRRK